MPKYYLLDENKNLVEGFDKEGFLALLQQAIDNGDLEHIDPESAVASKLRSTLNGTAHHIEFVTQAQYNQLEAEGELVENTYYFITDDTTADGLEAHMQEVEARMDVVEEHVRTGLKLAINSVTYSFDFYFWNTTTGASILQGRDINYVGLINDRYSTPETDRRVQILPSDTYTSIAEASVDYVSGDEGYIEYTLQPISNNIITFVARNISDKTIYCPKYKGTETWVFEEKSTTFRLHIKDIYGNEFNYPFTINFKLKV